MGKICGGSVVLNHETWTHRTRTRTVDSVASQGARENLRSPAKASRLRPNASIMNSARTRSPSIRAAPSMPASSRAPAAVNTVSSLRARPSSKRDGVGAALMRCPG